MLFWYILLFVVFYLCLLMNKTRVNNEKGNGVFFALVVLLLIIVAGIRTQIGDTDNYLRYINRVPYSFTGFIKAFSFESEWGFKIIVFVLKKIFFNNAQLVLAFFSTVSLILILKTIKKISKLYELCIYIFIASSAFIMLMNGVRQFFVGAIIFSLIPFINKKNFFKYAIIMLLLSTIHRSALLMIPVYFILFVKPWSKMSYVILFAGILLFVAFPLYNVQLANYLVESDLYSGYAYEISNFKHGANFIRTLVAIVPIIMSLPVRHDIEKNEKYYNIVFNLSLLNVIFYLLAVNHYIFARFCFYTILPSFVLLCWDVQYIHKKNTKLLVYMTCMFLYLIYYWYQVSIVWNTPYTTIFG